MSKRATEITPFRVHFDDGVKVDVPARNADEAKRVAAGCHDARVTKIKRIREPASA